MALQTLLTQIAALAQKELAPIVQEIDRKGVYPEQFMRELGKIGGYQSVGTVEEGGNGLGLTAQILAIREVGKICGATAFSVWCQAACAWYLHKTPPPKRAIWPTCCKAKCWPAPACRTPSNT